MVEVGERLLPLRAVCEQLSISRSTLYDLLKRGELKSVTFGRRNRRVAAAELQRFIAQHQQPGANDERGTQSE
jgi:excisionase family DNA binding protein